MFHKISVLIPTRNRLERVKKLLDSFRETSTPGASELVFRVDDDDYSYGPGVFEGFWVKAVRGPRYEGYKSMPAFFMDAFHACQGEVIMVGNDDMVFESYGWDESILAVANQYPDGLFNIGIDTHNAEHFPFSIVSRRMVECLGHIYDHRLFWGDIYLRDVVSHFGRTVRLNGVSVKHDWAGFHPDPTFMAAQNLKLTIGTSDYWHLHGQIVSEAINKLSAIVGVAA